jgi:hypothetical protein
MIAATDTVVRDEATLVSALDKELIMLDFANGKYLTINAVGTSVWQMIETPVPVETVVGQLIDLYEAPRDQILHDVLAFLDDLASRGLVLVNAK